MGGDSMFVRIDSCGCDCELGMAGSAGDADDARSSTELWCSELAFAVISAACALDLRRLALCGRSLGIANRLVCILLRAGHDCSEEI